MSACKNLCRHVATLDDHAKWLENAGDVIFQADLLTDQVVPHRKKHSGFLRCLRADGDDLEKILSSHPYELGQSTRIILVGFVPVGGEKPMCLKGFHANDVQPHFGEAAVEPAAHVACFKADLQSFPVLDAISEPTPNVLRAGQAFPSQSFLPSGSITQIDVVFWETSRPT